VGTFLVHSVYFSNANSRTASSLFSVLDLTYEINWCDCAHTTIKTSASKQLSGAGHQGLSKEYPNVTWRIVLSVHLLTLIERYKQTDDRRRQTNLQ